MKKLQDAFNSVVGNDQSARATIEKLSTDIAELTATYQSSLDEIASLKQALESSKQELSQLSAIKAEIEAKAKQEKAQSRFSSLAEVVGDVKAESLKAVYDNLSDEQFTTLLSTFQEASVKEDKSFAEQGTSEVVEPAEVLDEVKAQVAYTKRKNAHN